MTPSPFTPVFSFRVAEVHCPSCGGEFASMGIIGEDRSDPEEGDLLVCSYCAVLLKIHADLPVVLTPAEWQSLTPAHRRLLCRAQGVVFARAMGSTARGIHT